MLDGDKVFLRLLKLVRDRDASFYYKSYRCCCSSVVERVIGNDEVGSSILPSSTIPFLYKSPVHPVMIASCAIPLVFGAFYRCILEISSIACLDFSANGAGSVSAFIKYNACG